MTGVVLMAFGSYLLMLLAFHWSARRALHVPVMVSLMMFDLSMPFYLYATRDWHKRLIEQGDISSFGVWMHLGLVLTLYALYVFQVMSVRGVLSGNADARTNHHGQGKAMLVVRGLVILTGAMLAESPTESH